MDLSHQLVALSSPGYRKYWLGSFASVGATQLMILGQGWLMYELTESPLWLGYLGAAASLPTIALTLFGGALADRLDKRRVLMVTSLAVAVLLAVLAILDGSGLANRWHVLVIAALVSVVTGLDWPTRQAVFPLLIERELMLSAVALNSIIWQSTRMMMPALGGVVIAVADTSVVFGLCAAGFTAMFLVIYGLRFADVRSAAVGGTLSQIAEGVRYVVGNPTFFALITLSFSGHFFASAYLQLMPAFSDLLDAGETGYGLLVSMTGVGSVIGTVVAGQFAQSKRFGVAMLTASFLAGALIYLFALVTGVMSHVPGALALTMGVALIAALASSVFMIMSMTLLQLEVPDTLRGRVMGLHGITFSLMSLGGLFAGAIAAVSSTPLAIAVGATCHLAVLAIVIIRNRHLRAFDASETAH